MIQFFKAKNIKFCIIMHLYNLIYAYSCPSTYSQDALKQCMETHNCCMAITNEKFVQGYCWYPTNLNEYEIKNDATKIFPNISFQSGCGPKIIDIYEILYLLICIFLLSYIFYVIRQLQQEYKTKQKQELKRLKQLGEQYKGFKINHLNIYIQISQSYIDPYQQLANLKEDFQKNIEDKQKKNENQEQYLDQQNFDTSFEIQASYITKL